VCDRSEIEGGGWGITVGRVRAKHQKSCCGIEHARHSGDCF